MKIFFASQNVNKIKEIQSLLSADLQIVGIDDFIKDELEETGDTLEANALQKARFVAYKTGLPAFADDTGLEVAALNGEPGVISARYAGEGKDANANMAKLLSKLNGFSNRSAQFRTVIAYVNGPTEMLFEGVVVGQIALEPTGNEGFGYDPIFLPESSDRTFAQMSMGEKNEMSHRARAVKLFAEHLQKLK